jgi:hypothetical protein
MGDINITIKEIISDELINEFREVVNDNHMFVFHLYSNKKGKNQWNPICSCMDWISVAIRSIQDASKFSTNIDVKVMQIYSLISSIDIVNEAITSLHSILKGEKRRVSPFKGLTDCFSDTCGLADDDSHFKEIRARFGAHPVNLDGESGERLFASWPHNGSDDDYDLEVRLYSNIVGNEDKTFGIRLEELLRFMTSRYSYLNVLIDEINEQYILFCKKMQKKKITVSSSVIEQLDILQIESEQRLNNDYYRSTILDLKMTFSSTTGLDHLREQEFSYKEYQKSLLNEVKNNLQEMNLIDLVHCDVLKNRSPENELRYELPKLYYWIYSQKADPMLDFYMRRLNDISDNKYEFSELDGPERTYLKLNIFLHTFC